MKRYIRTKNGTIIDTQAISFGLDCNSVVYNEYINTVRKWKNRND